MDLTVLSFDRHWIPRLSLINMKYIPGIRDIPYFTANDQEFQLRIRYSASMPDRPSPLGESRSGTILRIPSAERNGNGNAVDRGIADIGVSEALQMALKAAGPVLRVAAAAAALRGCGELLQSGADGLGLACGVDIAGIHSEVLLILFRMTGWSRFLRFPLMCPYSSRPDGKDIASALDS
jgi:hypothetical protein